MSTDIAAQLRPVLDDLAVVVGNVQEGQLHDPTPCTEMDVQALRDHILDWCGRFSVGALDPEGRTPEQAERSGDPAADIRADADRFDAGLSAGALERQLFIGESGMPGEMAMPMILWEYQVHGWDLARATGQEWDPPADGVEASLAFAPSMLTPDYQGEGKTFGPRVDVPADAAPLDRLLGLSGRDPGWGHRSSTRPS